MNAVIEPPTSKLEALQREAAEAVRVQTSEKESNDQIDQWLRVASMAIDAGQPEYAREILIDITRQFEGLVGDKQFQAREGEALQTVGGKEEEKYFLGDPYEQMMAYFYLGLLDFQAGDLVNARISFRNASLADKASAAEGYDSDCSLALLLEGVCAQRLGMDSQADDAYRFAARAFSFRQNMPVAQLVLYKAVAELQPENADRKAVLRLDRAIPVIFERLPAVLSANHDLASAINESIDVAAAGLNNPEKKSAAAAYLDACDDKAQAALALLNEIRANALEKLTPDVLEPVERAKKQFAQAIETCKDPATNTFLIQQFGWAPAKIRTGRYGQVLQFYVYPSVERRAVNTLRRLDSTGSQYAYLAMPGESINYQATTRGGRQMDSILEGRAQFRDSMNVVSGLAMTAVPIAVYAGAMAASALVTTTTTTVTYTVSSTGAVTATTTTTTSTAPAGAAAATPFLIAAVAALVIYQGTKMIADATHPEGDIRGWHELPGQVLFMCGSLEPGDYEMTTVAFDNLAQPVDGSGNSVQFEVSQDRPTLIVANSFWK